MISQLLSLMACRKHLFLFLLFFCYLTTWNQTRDGETINDTRAARDEMKIFFFRSDVRAHVASVARSVLGEAIGGLGRYLVEIVFEDVFD